MSVDLKVETKELKKSAKRIEQHLQALNNEIRNLYEEDIYDLAKNWKDATCYNWTNKFTDYLSDLQSVSDSVAEYIAFLRSASEEYDKTVDECRQTCASKGWW